MKTKDRYVYMDFLKGIAMAMVVMVHFTSRLPELHPMIEHIGLYGQMGCQLFFVISAYFACMSLDKSENIKAIFIKKKIVRLMPGYIAAIMLHIPVVIIMRDYLSIEMNWPRTDIANIIANIFFLQHLGGIGGFNVLVTGSWYIFCLILFYIIFYFMKKYDWIRQENVNVWIIGSVIFALLIGVLIEKIFLGECGNNSYYYSSIIVQFPVMLFGIKLFFDDKLDKQRDVRLLALAVIVLYFLTMFLFFSGMDYVFVIIPTLTGIMFYALIVLVRAIFGKSGIENRVVVRLFSRLGEYSYEMLFMHIYPVSYGTRIIRVLLEQINVKLSGTVLFLILIIPMFVSSYLMAIMFRWVLNFFTRNGKNR